METSKQNHQIKSKFLDPEQLLGQLPLSAGAVVADFGCGNGYYSVAAGKMVGRNGQVYSVDILDEALSQTATLAKMVGLRNISTHECDLEKIGQCDIADTSCDLVIMSSILHQTKVPDNILREAYRVLKTGGLLLVVEWTSGNQFGPPVKSRIPKTDMRTLLERFSFRPVKEFDAGSFHYALLYNK